MSSYERREEDREEMKDFYDHDILEELVVELKALNYHLGHIEADLRGDNDE